MVPETTGPEGQRPGNKPTPQEPTGEPDSSIDPEASITPGSQPSTADMLSSVLTTLPRIQVQPHAASELLSKALSPLPDEKAAETLLAVLKYPEVAKNATALSAALIALTKIDPKRALPELESALKSDYRDVRKTATSLLYNIVKDSPDETLVRESEDLLIQYLSREEQENDWHMLNDAIHALDGTGRKTAMDALIKYLDHPEDMIRTDARKTLLSVERDALLDHLLSRLAEADRTEPTATDNKIIDLVVDISRQSDTDTFLQILKEDGNDLKKIAAVRSLGKISEKIVGGYSPQLRLIRHELLGLVSFRGNSSSVKEEALAALGKNSYADQYSLQIVKEALFQAVANEMFIPLVKKERQQAGESLGQIGASSDLPRLFRAYRKNALIPLYVWPIETAMDGIYKRLTTSQKLRWRLEKMALYPKLFLHLLVAGRS
ncbi:MAG: hypothetical protein D6719_12010 [Candidatus Dadabacteria bacterium]|nr:MAG: hypothetical protein D6719_12010 [Candidatus Dadabacteria bacterium]